MLTIPNHSHVPREQCTAGFGVQRYEDIVQDGRYAVLGMPHALGFVLWRQLVAHNKPLMALRQSGIHTVLTRMVCVGSDHRIAVTSPINVDGCYEVAQSSTSTGETDRLFLNMWVDMSTVSSNEAPVRIGKLFAEHMFTKLFADPGARRVTAQEVEGLASHSLAQYPWHPPHHVLELDQECRWLYDDFQRDPAPAAFGLDHTDSNQHVNSLVYPRLFIDAALRLMAVRGLKLEVCVREIEVAFRKPSFAGESLNIHVRLFERNGSIGAAGYFAAPGLADAERAHCFLKLLFR